MVRLLIQYGAPTDQAAFDRHYKEVHTPLAKTLPGLRQFTLSRNVLSVPGSEPAYLVAELDWDDMPSLGSAMQSPVGQAVGKDVEDNLVPIVTSLTRMIYDLETV